MQEVRDLNTPLHMAVRFVCYFKTKLFHSLSKGRSVRSPIALIF